MEKITGEPLTGDALRNRILGEFKIIAEEYNIDLDYIPPRKYDFILSEINRRLIKPNRQYILKTNPKHNEYDLAKVDYIYNIFKDLCKLYNQENSLALFISFTSITRETFSEWTSTGHSDIHKKIMADDEASLEQMLQDKALNPMKILPSLNKKHGWNLPGVSRETSSIPLSVQALPKLSDNTPALDDKNPDQ